MSIKNRYIFNQMAMAKGWLIKTFLLLLLLFVACGEPDDMFGTIHGDDEEIELTINTLLPDGGISTRTAPAENITSITALAFDRNHELIKVQTSVVVQPTTSNTTGIFKITVPQRTRRIHFIAKNNGEFTEITESDYGKTDVGLLVNRISSIQNSQDADGISNALHYWQMLDFESAEDLKDLSDELQALDKKTGYQLPLIRNMAKITLNLQNGMTGHIAGILNYNTTGTIVPYLKDGNNYTFGYQDKTNHELPSTFVITSDVSDCSELGTVHYLFEEYDDVGDLIYVMCYIENDGSGTEDSGHFYKVALVKPEFTGVEDKYYYVIRNQAYNINIVDKLDVDLGKTDYSDAVQYGKPINDSEKEQVHLDFEPDEVYMYIGEPGTVTVKIPEGITELQIGSPSERFDADGVIAKNTAGNNLENSTITNGNIHISTYDVTGLSEIVLSMNLKSSIQDAISGMELQFIGSGEDKIVNDKLVVHVLKRDALNVTPTAVEIPRTKGNSFSVNVIIPSFDNYDGAYELTVNDKDNKYNITAPGTLALHDGVYNVEKGQTYTFEFELREDGTAGEKHTIDFHLDTDYHDYDATTIVTLIDNVAHDQDYEIWVDNSTWTGTENSVTFFGYNKETPQGSFTTGTTPNGFRTEFYDAGANSHKSQSMVMGSDDSFTFTIPEGENRYLTMLVAANDGTSPSINLTGNLTNGTSWTTANSDDDESVPSNYNFGDGEIGSSGRLIRYELAPGTYTLQRGSADYLLYYMRLTRTKPEMTDVAQPLITDYTLNWSGATYVNTDAKGYLKINDSKYIVDQDNLNHTVILKSENNSLASSLNLSTFTLSEIDVQLATKVIAFQATNSNDLKITENNQGKSAQSNTCTLDTYNAGNYATSGTINEPDYKYEVFYEKLHLNSVQYEVKSPIIPRLYTSLDGDKLTPVDKFTNLDDAWAIGFKMPMVVPAPHSDLLPVAERYGNYTIDINIPEWTKRSDNTSSGLGVIVGNDKNYTLGKQSNSNSGGTEMLHPREGWTYKIAFESIPDSKQIVPSLNGGNKANDTDHYFIYNGTIAKAVTIPTPYEVINLNLQSLEFRSNSNNGDNQTYNLNFGDDFYLKATILPEDAQKYAGKFVKLQGSFSNQQNGGNSSIDWSKSRQDGSSIVDRNNNGNSLQFEIKAGQTEYEIHWNFVRPEGNTSNPVQFTYTVGNSDFTGDNTATATINLSDNGQSSDSQLNISLDFYADVYDNGTIDNNGDNFDNLLLGTSRVYLKATLSGNVPSSGTVQLQGEFNSPYQWANANGAIHWDDSRKSGDIIYYGNHNGEGLEFTIQSGKTEYLIDWVFVTGSNYPGSGDIQFTYRLSNNQGYTVTGDIGDNSPTFAFANEPISNGQIQVATNGQSGTTASIPLYYGQNSSEEFTVDVTIPAGVTQLNIQADDFNVSRVNGNNIDNSTSITTTGGETMRLKFTLKDGSHTDKNSTITFSGNNNVSSATVNVDLSPRASESSGVTTIWNGWAQLNWAYGINYLSTGYQIPVGSVVTLNFTTTGGSIKLHDFNGGANIIALPGRDYGNNDNLGIIPVNSGDTSFSFNVTNDIKVNNQNINGYLNGLKINGENVILTSIVVSTSSSGTVEYDFENGQRIDGWNNVTTSIVYDNIAQSNVLRIEMQQNNNNWGQLGIGGGNYSGKYKLFLKFKKGSSSSSGTMKLAFQDSSNNYEKRATIDLSLSANADDSWHSIEQDVTLSGFADQFVIQLEGVNGGTVIYIDDLKLVRTN